jgi:hypothetical protein
MSEAYEAALRGDTATGFATAATLFRELLQHDRETTALVSVLSSRLTSLADDVGRLLQLVERGNGRDSLVVQLHALRQELADLQRWREGRAHWTAVLERVQAEVGELQRRDLPPEVHIEGVRGRWAAIGLAITAASALGLGLLNLLK